METRRRGWLDVYRTSGLRLCRDICREVHNLRNLNGLEPLAHGTLQNVFKDINHTFFFRNSHKINSLQKVITCRLVEIFLVFSDVQRFSHADARPCPGPVFRSPNWLHTIYILFNIIL